MHERAELHSSMNLSNLSVEGVIHPFQAGDPLNATCLISSHGLDCRFHAGAFILQSSNFVILRRHDFALHLCVVFAESLLQGWPLGVYDLSPLRDLRACALSPSSSDGARDTALAITLLADLMLNADGISHVWLTWVRPANAGTLQQQSTRHT